MQRYRRRGVWRLALLAAVLVAATVSAEPARVRCGPTQAGCGPAAVVGSGGTGPATVLIPAAGGSDVNCPASTPTHPTTNGGFSTWANLAQTCATGASAYSVTSISVFVAAANAGTNIKCSVYDAAAPGATKNHLAAGCDSVDTTLAANPAAWVTMATTGTCTLLPSTRYWIACTASDASITVGEDARTCPNCFPWHPFPTPYTTPWPATLSGGGVYSDQTYAYYLTATPTVITTTTSTSTTTTTAPPSAVNVPALVNADANCPTTIPAVNGNGGSGWNGYAVYGQTCPTGSNANGYDVNSISTYIAGATAGGHLKCSVYADVSFTHLAAGCDSVEATLTANPAAYVTMSVSGACHLAPSTRYQIACATDSGATTYGTVSPSCALCWPYMGSVPYPPPWPATLSRSSASNVTGGSYLTVTASP